jgi:hypothetical protein
MKLHWLNKDVANILKSFSDPLTYFKLLLVARVFHPINRERYLNKLRKYYYQLLRNSKNMRITRSMKRKRTLIYNKITDYHIYYPRPSSTLTPITN